MKDLISSMIFSYRHNIGDTLVNACYVLRDNFLETLLGEMKTQMAQAQASGQVPQWEVGIFSSKKFLYFV